jgi:hypothetical protein
VGGSHPQIPGWFCRKLTQPPSFLREGQQVLGMFYMAPEEGLGLTSSEFPNKLRGFCKGFDGTQAKSTKPILTHSYQSGVSFGVSSKNPS